MKIVYRRDGKEQFTTATLKAKPIAAEEPPKLNVSDKLVLLYVHWMKDS